MTPRPLNLLVVALGLTLGPAVGPALGPVRADARLEAQSRPPDGEPLWVGVFDRNGHLLPLARYTIGSPAAPDGAWDEPWPETFIFEGLRFDRRTGEPLFVDVQRAWAADQETRSSWRRTKSAPARWYLHAPQAPVTPLDATSLTVTNAQCLMAWKLNVEETSQLRAPPPLIGDRDERFVGLAFSRPADAAVDEADIPALDRIRRELGLVDRTRSEDERPGEYTGGDYTWLGSHRFGDLLLGVVFGAFYEGERYFIVEIDGDGGRIASSFYGGGC